MVVADTRFGAITIDRETYEHDTVVRISGDVVQRKYDLGGRDSLFLLEGLQVFGRRTGQSGLAGLSANAAKKGAIGLFHVIC